MTKTYKDLGEGASEVIQQCKHWENEHPHDHNLVLIAGPAGSGKTTFSKMIANSDTLILSLDRYYL